MLLYYDKKFAHTTIITEIYVEIITGCVTLSKDITSPREDPLFTDFELIFFN